VTDYAITEASVFDMRPVELYAFDIEGSSFNLTSHDEDFTDGGVLYSATQIDHGNISVMEVGRVRELTVNIKISHPLALLLMTRFPTRRRKLTITRLHRDQSAGFQSSPTSYLRQIWKGKLQSCESDFPTLRIRVPNAIDAAFDVELPILKAQTICQRHLYTPGCDVARSHLFNVAPTVSAIDGRDLVVSSMFGQVNDWAKYGEVVRLADGQTRGILEQVGTAITLDHPFATLNNGDQIEVWAGCDGLPTTCRTKFGNMANFGNHPHMPLTNIASVTAR
jgi:hypothetical protein